MRIWAKFFVLAIVLTAAAARAEPPVARCDALAGDPHDPKRVGAGVLFFEMEVSDAVVACEAAVGVEPGTARLQYQYARALARMRRADLARDFMRKAADQGYPIAQAELGYMLIGADAAEEGLRLTRLAADQGLALAKGDLGWRYAIGDGVPKDYEKALALIREAVFAGDEYAMDHLGEIYENGWGVKPNDIEAVKWYRAASERRYRGAWYHLANLMLQGRGGLVRDEAQAQVLLERAVGQGLHDAYVALQKLREARGK